MSKCFSCGEWSFHDVDVKCECDNLSPDDDDWVKDDEYECYKTVGKLFELPPKAVRGIVKGVLTMAADAARESGTVKVAGMVKIKVRAKAKAKSVAMLAPMSKLKQMVQSPARCSVDAGRAEADIWCETRTS